MSEFDELKQDNQGQDEGDVVTKGDSGEVNTPMDFSKAEHFSNDNEVRMQQLMSRLKLKNKILTYQVKFREELLAYEYKMSQLDELSIPDLELFLQEIRIAVRQRNSSAMTKSFYFGAVNLFEKASSKVGFDVTGLHQSLYTQSEIHKCLDEIALEYEDSINMPAHIRLPFITLQAALSINAMNNTRNIINTEMNKTISKDLVDEYKDL